MTCVYTPFLENKTIGRLVVVALLALLVLVGLTPVFIVFCGPAGLAVVAVAAAIALGAAGFALRSAEGAHVWRLVRPFAALLAVPALWMLVQLLPLPFGLFANSTWDSANVALGQAVASRVSVDVGATVIALLQYLTACAIIVAAAAVAVDRGRAEQILFVVSFIPAAAGVLLVADAAGLRTLWIEGDPDGLAAVARTCVGLGAVFSAASVIRAYERFETRGANHSGSPIGFLQAMAASGGLCAFFWIVLFVFSPQSELMATAAGFALIPALVVVRRMGFGRWGLGFVMVAVVIASLLAAVTNPDIWSRQVFANTNAVSTTQRMVADAAPLGSGAGTFSVLLALYRGGDNAPAGGRSGAGVAVVEMGAAFVVFGFIGSLIAIAILLAGALARGRDSFYALGGASATAMLLANTFTGHDILGLATLILGGAGLGLGIAQRFTRTAS